MSAIAVSTVLLTKNSLAGLQTYMPSMREVDDIVVLDGGSTDGTVEFLQEQANCRVFPQNPKYIDEQGYIIHFSALRNEGYALAKHRWILCVDADEAASPALLNEVRDIVERNDTGVYYAKRQFTWKGKPVLMLEKSTVDHIRLFSLDVVRGCVKPVHERLDVLPGAKRGTLNETILVPLPEPASVRRKYDRYLRIDTFWNRHMTWKKWLRWVLLRNLIAIVRRSLVILAVRLIPRSGQRYPLALEYEQLRYSWKFIWTTCPALNHPYKKDIRTQTGEVAQKPPSL